MTLPEALHVFYHGIIYGYAHICIRYQTMIYHNRLTLCQFYLEGTFLNKMTWYWFTSISSYTILVAEMKCLWSNRNCLHYPIGQYSTVAVGFRVFAKLHRINSFGSKWTYVGKCILRIIFYGSETLNEYHVLRISQQDWNGIICYFGHMLLYDDFGVILTTVYRRSLIRVRRDGL